MQQYLDWINNAVSGVQTNIFNTITLAITKTAILGQMQRQRCRFIAWNISRSRAHRRCSNCLCSNTVGAINCIQLSPGARRSARSETNASNIGRPALPLALQLQSLYLSNAAADGPQTQKGALQFIKCGHCLDGGERALLLHGMDITKASMQKLVASST